MRRPLPFSSATRLRPRKIPLCSAMPASETRSGTPALGASIRRPSPFRLIFAAALCITPLFAMITPAAASAAPPTPSATFPAMSSQSALESFILFSVPAPQLLHRLRLRRKRRRRSRRKAARGKLFKFDSLPHIRRHRIEICHSAPFPACHTTRLGVLYHITDSPGQSTVKEPDLGRGPALCLTARSVG